jgi:8-oxo-dGTP diphosphatase
METKTFTATKAFIDYQGKILILREAKTYKDGSNIGKYHIPGGRVKPGQNWKESLLREIKEESGLDIKIGKPFFVSEWRPVVKNEEWQIIGIFFKCYTDSDKVKLSEEHDDFLWINPKNYKEYDLVEDLIPVFVAYLNQ